MDPGQPESAVSGQQGLSRQCSLSPVFQGESCVGERDPTLCVVTTDLRVQEQDIPAFAFHQNQDSASRKRSFNDLRSLACCLLDLSSRLDRLLFPRRYL